MWIHSKSITKVPPHTHPRSQINRREESDELITIHSASEYEKKCLPIGRFQFGQQSGFLVGQGRRFGRRRTVETAVGAVVGADRVVVVESARQTRRTAATFHLHRIAVSIKKSNN